MEDMVWVDLSIYYDHIKGFFDLPNPHIKETCAAGAFVELICFLYAREY